MADRSRLALASRPPCATVPLGDWVSWPVSRQSLQRLAKVLTTSTRWRHLGYASMLVRSWTGSPNGGMSIIISIVKVSFQPFHGRRFKPSTLSKGTPLSSRRDDSPDWAR